MTAPRCFTCDGPLTTNAELNRRIDYGQDICDVCLEADEDDSCWCGYGFYLGGDPRQFQPDEENTDEMLAAWRAACEAWAQGKAVDLEPEEHGPWVDPATGKVTLGLKPSPDAIGACHALRSYGMGSYYCDQHKQPADAWRRVVPS